MRSPSSGRLLGTDPIMGAQMPLPWAHVRGKPERDLGEAVPRSKGKIQMETAFTVGQGVTVNYGEIIFKRYQLNNVKCTEMNLIFRSPCILLTCTYVQLCVCKYIAL